MTGCYFGRTPLSPLLKVVLLHGSKLINLSNVGLSRWHYPDSYIYWHVFAVILSDLRNVIHTPQGRGEDFPSHQLHFFFYRPTPSFHPHQFLPHPLLNWSFQMTAPYSKFSFTTKWHGTNLVARFPLNILCFSYSPSLKVKDNTLSYRPFVSSNTAGPISCALSNSLFLPPPHTEYSF